METMTTAVVEAAGWTLLHSVWQGLVIWLVCWAVVRLVGGAKMGVQYVVGCAGAVVMLGAAAGTFVVSLEPVGTPAVPAVAAAEAGAVAVEVPMARPDAGSVPAAEVAVPLAHEVGGERLDWAPVVVGLWVVGVGFFSLRLLMGWLGMRRLVRSGRAVEDGTVVEAFDRLVGELRLRRPVALLVSTRAAVPMVIGWLKPVVLVPAGVLCGLERGHLEAILAHELAHVRRWDYLANLVMGVLEALFFYHPVVWWLGSLVRESREHCCDDVAVEVSGGAACYGRALLALEAFCGGGGRVAVAATGGSLLRRIRRLSGVSERRRSAWPAGLVGLAAVVGLAWPTSSALVGTAEALEQEERSVSGALGTKLDVGTIGEAERNQLAWGEHDREGLAAAVRVRPLKKAYGSGDVLEREYVIGNFGETMVELTLGHWLQDDVVGLRLVDGEGERLNSISITDSGATMLIGVKLRPGEFVRVPSSPVYVGPIPRGEGVSPSGTYIEAPDGVVGFMSATLRPEKRAPLRTGKTRLEIRADGEGKKDKVALTFMTGPHPTHTAAILDLLKESGAKATFFVVGKSVRRYPDVLKRMVAEGHQVGTMGERHTNLAKLSAEALLAELRKGHEAIVEACGVAPTVLRPPYGALEEAQKAMVKRELGYEVVLWSVDPRDWQRPGADVVAERVFGGAESGSIVALHDLHGSTVEATRLVLERLGRAGFSMVTVGQLEGAEAPEENEAPPKSTEVRRVKVKGTIVDAETGEAVTKFVMQSGKFEAGGDFKDVKWGYGERRSSKEDGTFFTSLRWDDGWTARIVADGYLPMPVLARAPGADEDEIEVTLKLEKGELVRGTVVGHDGAPVAGAAVFRVGPVGLRLAGGKAWSSFGNQEDTKARPVTTDAQGRFELSRGGAERLAVSCEALDAWSAAIPADVATEGMEIRLPAAGRVEVRYEIEGGGAETPVFLQLLGHTMEGFRGVEVVQTVPVANGGTLVFDALPPGNYQFCRNEVLRVKDFGMGAMLDRTFVKLEAGGTERVGFVREAGARLEGRVVYPEGVKVDGVVVRVEAAAPTASEIDGREWTTGFAGVIAGEDGAFTTAVVPPGKCVVKVEVYEPVPENDRWQRGRRAPKWKGEVEVEVPESGVLAVGEIRVKG